MSNDLRRGQPFVIHGGVSVADQRHIVAHRYPRRVVVSTLLRHASVYQMVDAQRFKLLMKRGFQKKIRRAFADESIRLRKV